MFDIICNNGFGFHDFHLSYASDVRSCADRCARWNLGPNLTVACVGATFDFGFYGPSGKEGGSQCWLKYNVNVTGDHTKGLNSVRLKDAPPPVLSDCCVANRSDTHTLQRQLY